MIAITSISPTHIHADIQSKAIQSWMDLGMEVISVNSPKEIEILETQYKKVRFIPTIRTLEKTYGKPYVQISAIIDICKTLRSKYYCIINSDIELRSDKDTIERIKVRMADNIILANRINHNGDYIGAKYLLGIDVFFIHQRFLDSFPQSMHGLGMTFVDYFIPYSATKSGIQCVFIEQDFAYHKDHPAQYSSDNWKKSGRYFLWENNLYQFNDTSQVGNMSTFVYNFIYSATTKETI